MEMADYIIVDDDSEIEELASFSTKRAKIVRKTNFAELDDEIEIIEERIEKPQKLTSSPVFDKSIFVLAEKKIEPLSDRVLKCIQGQKYKDLSDIYLAYQYKREKLNFDVFPIVKSHFKSEFRKARKKTGVSKIHHLMLARHFSRQIISKSFDNDYSFAEAMDAIWKDVILLQVEDASVVVNFLHALLIGKANNKVLDNDIDIENSSHGKPKDKLPLRQWLEVIANFISSLTRNVEEIYIKIWQKQSLRMVAQNSDLKLESYFVHNLIPSAECTILYLRRLKKLISDAEVSLDIHKGFKGSLDPMQGSCAQRLLNWMGGSNGQKQDLYNLSQNIYVTLCSTHCRGGEAWPQTNIEGFKYDNLPTNLKEYFNSFANFVKNSKPEYLKRSIQIQILYGFAIVSVQYKVPDEIRLAPSTSKQVPHSMYKREDIRMSSLQMVILQAFNERSSYRLSELETRFQVGEKLLKRDMDVLCEGEGRCRMFLKTLDSDPEYRFNEDFCPPKDYKLKISRNSVNNKACSSSLVQPASAVHEEEIQDLDHIQKRQIHLVNASIFRIMKREHKMQTHELVEKVQAHVDKFIVSTKKFIEERITRYIELRDLRITRKRKGLRSPELEYVRSK